MIYTKHTTITLLFLAFSFWANAQKLVIKGDSLNDLSVNTLLSVVDDRYNDMLSSTWTEEFNHNNVTGILAFGIDKHSLKDQLSPFSVSLTVEVSYKTHAGTSFNNHSLGSQSININYDPSNTSTAEVMLKIPNAHEINAEIIQSPANTGVKLYAKAQIHMNRYFHFDRNTLPSGFQIGAAYAVSNNTIHIDWSDIPNALEYDLEWAHIGNSDGIPNGTISAGALEILYEKPFIQSSRVSTPHSEYNIPAVFDKGYLLYRVRGKGHDHGDNYTEIFEGLWSSEGNDPTTVGSFGDFINVSPYAHEGDKNWNYQAVFTENGRNKYSLTYADGSGRARQTVVNQNDKNETVVAETYYDHQGRAAIQALPAPTGSPIIQYYEDFNLSGETGLPYSKADFDAAYLPEDCETTTRPFSIGNTPSAGNYYSEENPSIAVDEDMYVPNAYGFPFSQTVYTNDNTGRVKKSTIPGLEFKKNNDKETRYLYTTPFQEELDALFGTNAGLAHKYKKNVVIDANNQASITYINPADQTIATVLSGNGENNTVDLPSYNADEEFYWVDLLSKQDPADDVGLLEKIDYSRGIRDFSRAIPILNKNAQEFYYKIEGDSYTPECEVPEENPSNKCYDCVVDIEISLKDECGVEYLSGVKENGENEFKFNEDAGDLAECDGEEEYDKQWKTNIEGVEEELKVGVYNLTKQLRIDHKKLNEYAADFLASDESCLKTQEQFKQQELSKLMALNDCAYDCAQCKEDYGETYKDSPFNMVLHSNTCDPCLTEYEYDLLLKECLAACEDQDKCAISFQMLLSDMSPGGQYALSSQPIKLTLDDQVTAPSNDFDPWKFPLSILNENNQLPLRELSQVGNNQKTVVVPSWRNPIKVNVNGQLEEDPSVTQYLNYDGTALKVYLTNNNDGTYSPEINGTAMVDTEGFEYVYAKKLKNVKDFVDYWRPEWAELLVAYHPEFGSYQYCQLMTLSHAFDQELINADEFGDLPEDYQEIFENSVGSNEGLFPFFREIDPYFNNDQNPYESDINDLVNSFRNKLNAYASDGPNGSEVRSIWQIAWLIGNCENPACEDNCQLPSDLTLDDNSWPMFRAM